MLVTALLLRQLFHLILTTILGFFSQLLTSLVLAPMVLAVFISPVMAM